jgi:hypothetical protein
MASDTEIRANQANLYYVLLAIKAQNPDKDVVGLDEAVIRARVPMNETDIAWVEKQVMEAFK